MEKKIIVCESCHIDYGVEYTKLIESQGETFCLSCYDEWKSVYEKEMD